MSEIDALEWCARVEALCITHLKCTWNDLCGDMEPLQDAIEDELTPYEFVHNWAAKYDLEWYEEADK